jgi:class 3 adenylate cyclase
VFSVVQKWLRQLDYRLSPQLEIEYEDKTNEMTNRAFLYGVPTLSICLWVWFFSSRFTNNVGDSLTFAIAVQGVLALGIFAILLRGRMRRILNYFSPVLTLSYVYALIGVYVATLPDQAKMVQAQNWVICLVFFLYAVERVSPFLAVLNAGSSTLLFYFLQASVPQLIGAESFQFNWQLAAAHGVGLFICFDQCINARRKFKFEKDLDSQRQHSDKILRNVLPDVIVDELKTTRSTLAHAYSDVTVIFIDLVGFTKKSATMEPALLVNLLDELFSRFDELASKYGVEKIKTIGDAYMAATGCPRVDSIHAQRMIEFALALENVMKVFNSEFAADFGIKVGIASGTVMGGVIGKKRISFDLWGDVVNLASRIESIAADGEIAVSESTAALIKERVTLSQPRIVELKGKGPTTVYSVRPKVGLLPAAGATSSASVVPLQSADLSKNIQRPAA